MFGLQSAEDFYAVLVADLDDFMAQVLKERLRSVQNDLSLRTVVLRGAGNDFMNGHDLDAYKGSIAAIRDAALLKAQMFGAVIRGFREMDKPIIAAVDGQVSGAGLSFILASDFVLATRRTVFNGGFMPNASAPDGGVSFFLPRKVGALRAAEMLLLSEDIPAETAEKWGLINRTVANDALEAEALALAEKLARVPTRVLGEAKSLIGKSLEHDLSAQLVDESVAWTKGSKMFDFMEFASALAAKRAPQYKGT